MVELLHRLGYGYDARFTWIAAGLIAVGVLLVAWVVLPERWRRLGRPRIACPRCHYDLRGIVGEAAFPVTCAECGLEISAEKLKRKPRPVRRMLAIALLLLVAAHVTALWPQVKRVGAKRLIPTTILVLQPMDVGKWTDAHLRHGMVAVNFQVRRTELGRRLNAGQLWRWQEWLLYTRVGRACRGRADYGITPSQYDTAVRLHTTRADPRDGETVSPRLEHLAESAGVSFRIDWDTLSSERIFGLYRDDLAEPTEPNATVARALDLAIDPDGWDELTWDITHDGAVVILWEKDASTTRSRIYDVSDLMGEADDPYALTFLIDETIVPDHWIRHGGSVNSSFAVWSHLVIVAPARVHLQIEDLLDGLRDAIASGPPPSPPHDAPCNPRQITGSRSLLDDLRILRTVSPESVRAAGPSLDDGVTEQELDACGRAAFGLLDRIREPSPSPSS